MKAIVFVEQRDGNIKKSSCEAIHAAASRFDSCTAVVIGPDLGDAYAGLGAYGASKVIAVTGDGLENYSVTAYAKAFSDIVRETGADVVLFSATAMAKDLAPRVAVRLDAALASDCTELTVEGEEVIATRPVYAGKAFITVSLSTPVKIFSLRPNVFTIAETSDTQAEVEKRTPDLSEDDFAVRVVETKMASDRKDVVEADIIISGGRGMGAPENWNLIEDLADVLDAATGASRAVVDAGWRPHAEQVGQTGKTVAPSLYIACGISGAIQHLAGMSSSKCIVAINKDPEAPIFKVADYGIIGDVMEVLPALTNEIKSVVGK